ncbi:MAG: hypothetical protein H5U40_16090, partial [Polyangiaceae bacterium]|nr:hypothetical protein [Polyangiaceae bacterium]
PASAPFDLDGHPGEELAVEVEVGGRRCVALVRITEEGGAFEVPLPLASLPGAPCAERLVDVVGDSRPELIATVRFDEVGTDPAPSVPIALEPARRGYRLLSPALAPVFFEGDRRSREAALADAAGPERIRLAVELAAIARISGKPREEAEAIFDRAVAGLDEALAEASSSARALVTAGLGLEPVLDGPP